MVKELIDLQNVYLNQMIEVRERLDATQRFIDLYLNSNSNIEFDCGVLQFRKALEATAYASIAPNKATYRAFRQKGKQASDFTKDFNASKIFQYLRQSNKDFYPRPLMPATKLPNEPWSFSKKENGFLTEKHFSRIYDRLGKFLHADNPWDTDKQRHNLAQDIPGKITEIRELLVLHATFVKVKKYQGVWVVELPMGRDEPTIITGIASGDFEIR